MMIETEARHLAVAELFRYIHLNERYYGKTTTESRAIYSVWKLSNCDLFPIRPNEIEETVEGTPSEDTHQICRFTAHAHHGEPITPSPDDRLIYSLKYDEDTQHFIVNRYTCRIIRKPEWM